MNAASDSLSLNGAAGESASRPDVYAAADKPKPRRGNAHPDFTPKDELRRQLEVERAENVVLREIASRARRNAALALAACLLLLAASVVRTFA